MVQSTSTDRPGSEETPDVDERVDAVFSTAKRIRAALVADLAPRWLGLNLTMAQVHVLHAVRRLGRVSGRQLAAELGVSPAAVVPVCDRLDQQGYLERVRDGADRRIQWLQLTPAGVEMVDGFSGGKARIGRALARLSDADFADLLRSLKAVAEALEADSPRPDPEP
jgi:DNA-binding MarR family transcriptional regulator